MSDISGDIIFELTALVWFDASEKRGCCPAGTTSGTAINATTAAAEPARLDRRADRLIVAHDERKRLTLRVCALSTGDFAVV
jgi:hypothetical protein